MAQASELAGGTGFTFEDLVAASYVTALLQEGFAPGVENRIVSRVALQQRDFGEPLDDVIIDFRGSNGDPARLSLQVKRSLTISDAKTNTDFREIIRDSWLTMRKADFRKGTDRFGAAVGEIASERARGLRSICEQSRASTSAVEFESRFTEGGNASISLKSVKASVTALVEEAAGGPVASEDVHQFFAHFVLIEFDFLHEGGASYPNALNALRSCLATDQASDAPAIWALICRMVREGAGRMAIFSRSSLVRRLSTSVRLAGSQSLRADLGKITRLTGQWIRDIEDDVGGAKLDRNVLASELERAIATSRVVQIRGLPGSGKSVLLRRRAEEELTQGPVLLLKPGRLEGTGWVSFAQAHGLSDAPLSDLLVEIGATGSSTLYIDGIDRIERKHQPIILDLIHAILETPELDNWRIVVSLRDSGIEPLRNWLGKALDSTGVSTVDVNALDDIEADLLARAKPHLRSLLFGAPEVREIVRRPFFAKVLDQTFGSVAGDDAFQPQSEIDLIAKWWLRGGYIAEGQAALARQRAIVELGFIRARHLERDIALRDLSPETFGTIDELVADGILQYVQAGHSVRFSHDILFEWAFLQVLAGRGDSWLEEIRACGEPPAVARVVELMSQWQYREADRWCASLDEINSSHMRSQWTRAWLLAPVLAPNFSTADATFADAVMANNFHFLQMALVWFQAERTTPNPRILQQDLPQDQRIRMADYLGWPSDSAAWTRFIQFLLARATSIPVKLYPDIVSIFDVWQNAFAGWRNAVSDAVLEQSWVWLRGVEEHFSAKRPSAEPSRWGALDRGVEDFRRALRSLVLRSSEARPDLTRSYLDLVIASEKLRNEEYSKIIQFSSILARTQPDQLVDLSLRHLKEELPQDRHDRELEEMRREAALRKLALAKPRDEWTRIDQLAAENTFGHLGSQPFSYHDWESLSVDRDFENSWPPSPLREPFHSLFNEAPSEGLRLLAELSNHAMTAWRQLHRLDYERRGTPIPLDIQFEWGTQRFWGGDREYLWHRGMWAPKALASGYLALEEWALCELANGRPVDELIQQIVTGNECIAVLGPAVTIVLQSEAMTWGVFSLVNSQRLLGADYHRWAHDFTDKVSSLIGFMKNEDIPHAEAVRAANDRPFRTRELKSVISRLFLFGGKDMSERVKEAVDRFVDDLPFSIEEHRNDQAAREHLMRQAQEYAELVDLENYRQVQAPEVDQVVIFHESPTLTSPERIAQAKEALVRLQAGNLWAWASKYFESGEITEGFTIQSAVEFAESVDNTSLYEASSESDELIGMRRGAVAAAAAVALNHREELSEDDLVWARQVLRRALRCPEHKDTYWSRSSIIPWHPLIFVARGLAADVRAGDGGSQAPHDLIALVAHPLEIVSLAAIEESLSLWDMDPRLGWSALRLGLTLCEFEIRHPPFPDESARRVEVVRRAVEMESQQYDNKAGWPDLPIPPPAWVRADGNLSHSRHRDDIDFAIDGDSVNAEELWAPSLVRWHSTFASKVIHLVPNEAILDHEAGEKLNSFLVKQLSWANTKQTSPRIKSGHRDQNSAGMYEWIRALGRLLGMVAGYRSLEEVKQQFLNPIFELDDERCWALLDPFVEIYICHHLYDAETVPTGASQLLGICLERMLQDSKFDPQSYRAGELTGMHLPKLAQALMFITVEHAPRAARFANGNWTDIHLIMPIVDRYVRAAGWSSTIMSFFLTLCERAGSSYPADPFADQILAIVGVPEIQLPGWRSTMLPARIAGLVQQFASRETPMPRALGQKLLRILDILVDMGDRRSAALQLSEMFREIQTG